MLQEHFPINFSHKVGALLLPPGWDVSLLVMGSISTPRSREKWSKVCGKRKHHINSVLPNEKAHLELVHILAHHRKKMAPIAAA